MAFPPINRQAIRARTRNPFDPAVRHFQFGGSDRKDIEGGPHRGRTNRKMNDSFRTPVDRAGRGHNRPRTGAELVFVVADERLDGGRVAGRDAAARRERGFHSESGYGYRRMRDNALCAKRGGAGCRGCIAVGQ